ncbi:MAG: hypothetical protein G3M78_08230 [Candidatus Nitrohelix vancouverensis]|uniref:SEC-C domain-containing protein n=1 Tax=Candidatus Nitrohelix vancouverensis TaxID=2705534 RepID=A0A7T0C2L0_9BACT|nr:MAG: hypothetical protein G3M78_08230 [Candidatus Nitrohelix vancouverensis]
MKDDLRSLVEEQFADLKKIYKNLSLISQKENPFAIRGPLGFYVEIGGNSIKDCFEIEIVIPEDYPESPPKVRELLNRIPKDFHKIQDDFLCLAAPLEVRLKFSKDKSLVGFVEKFVVPYLYSFCCWEKNGDMPFGERSHGVAGVLEQYRDILDVDTDLKALCLIKVLVEGNYRGHLNCPCGSDLQLRKCHGPVLLQIKKHRSQEGFFFDFLDIIKLLYNNKESLPECLKSKKMLRVIDKFSKKKKMMVKKGVSRVHRQKKAS